MQTSIAYRSGRSALLSGAIGILAVGLLVAALAAPTPAPNTMRRETSLFAWQNVGVILQSLGMIPVTLGLYRLALQRDPNSGLVNFALGLFAQVSLVIASALLFTDSVSDMLYMAPIGFVGLWLLIVNRRDGGYFRRAFSGLAKSPELACSL